MQVQRFRSPSVRGALSAVKESLGLEAPVLSTQFAPDRLVRPPDSPATALADTAGSQEIMARLSAVGLDRHLATEAAAALPSPVRRAPSEGTPITLVAADGYRVGAVEQLRWYAEILHVASLMMAASTSRRDPLREPERVIAATGSPMASALFGELGIPVDLADGSAMEASCV